MRLGLKKIFILPLIVAIAALVSLVTMLLWNALMPDIFGLPEITYFQALGLLVLSKILFGRFGSHKRHGKFGGRCGHFKDKWKNMTPEEREKFMNFRHQRGMGGEGFNHGNFEPEDPVKS